MADWLSAVRAWKIGLAPKLLATTILIVVGVSITMSERATSQLERSLVTAFESKGEAIALALAAATEQSAGTNISTIQGSIDANKVIDGVKYIFIQDSRGAPYVHTFSPTFPVGLERVNPMGLDDSLQGKRIKVAGDVRFDSPYGTIRAIDIAAPVAGGALGTVHVGMDPEVIDAQVAALRSSMLTWGGGVAFLGVALSLLITTVMVIRPIQELTRVTGDIVRKGDLTQKITVSSTDEVGQLAGMFSEMVEKLREIPTSLRHSTELLTESVKNLSASAAEQAETVTRQAAALQETQVTVQQIKQTSLLAAQKAEAVLEVAHRADEISRSGEAAIEQSLRGLADIRRQVEDIAAKIGELSERTRQIGLITETVKDLADQSNMLALNSAIEAVRSGEHGKGFAVVAREIRSLADQSIQATKRVREVLEDTSSAIRTAVAITEKGAQRMEGGLVQMKVSGENLRELSNIVKDNSAGVRQIAAAVSQQNAGIAQIFSAVSDLNKLMDQTLVRLESTTKSVDVLREVSDRVSTLVKGFRV